MEYRSTQVGWPILIPVVLGAVAPLILFNVPGADRAPGARVFWVLVPVLFFAMALLFGWLSVAVESGALRVVFGIGLIRKTIPLPEIASAGVSEVSALSGWGIRMTADGWLWRASGTRAVRLDLRSGKRFSVGASDPEGLLQALRAYGVRAV